MPRAQSSRTKTSSFASFCSLQPPSPSLLFTLSLSGFTLSTTLFQSCLFQLSFSPARPPPLPASPLVSTYVRFHPSPPVETNIIATLLGQRAFTRGKPSNTSASSGAGTLSERDSEKKFQEGSWLPIYLGCSMIGAGGYRNPGEILPDVIFPRSSSAPRPPLLHLASSPFPPPRRFRSPIQNRSLFDDCKR